MQKDFEKKKRKLVLVCSVLKLSMMQTSSWQIPVVRSIWRRQCSENMATVVDKGLSDWPQARSLPDWLKPMHDKSRDGSFSEAGHHKVGFHVKQVIKTVRYS